MTTYEESKPLQKWLNETGFTEVPSDNPKHKVFDHPKYGIVRLWEDSLHKEHNATDLLSIIENNSNLIQDFDTIFAFDVTLYNPKMKLLVRDDTSETYELDAGTLTIYGDSVEITAPMSLISDGSNDDIGFIESRSSWISHFRRSKKGE